MAKHKYTMLVKKVVVYDEMTIQVVASSYAEAKKLSIAEVEYKNWVNVDDVKYKSEVFCHSANPVE